MECLEGQTLANIVAHGDRNALPLAAHLSLVSDVLNGLQYSHDLCDFDGKPLEVVHRVRLGVMLWEAVTGHKRWRGLSDATIMNRVINGEIPSPPAVRPTVPEALERLIMKALSPEREDRRGNTLPSLVFELTNPEVNLASTLPTQRTEQQPKAAPVEVSPLLSYVLAGIAVGAAGTSA